MEENYIHIFCYFMGDLLEQKKVSPQDFYFLLSQFEPICDGIKTRGGLIDFLDSYVDKYPGLNRLKKNLSDSNFIFS